MFSGRVEYLDRFKKAWKNAMNGHGTVFFIKGEAGIGKTALVEEFMRRVSAFKVIARCAPVISPPLYPVREALRKLGLESLISSGEIPKLIMLYVIDSAGMLVASAERVSLGIDTDIFTSMLSAVSMFVKDSLNRISKGEEYLEELRYGNYNLVMKQGENVTLVAVLEGRSTEFFHTDLQNLLKSIEDGYGALFQGWDGNMEKMQPVKEELEKFIKSGKYDGGVVESSFKEWNFENIRLGIERVRKDSPAVIFIDDIQWADEATASLFVHFARNVSDSGVILIATCRSDEYTSVAENIEHFIVREALGEVIDLAPLNFDECVQIAESMLNGSISISLANFLYRSSEGVPLHLVELIRLIQEENLIGDDGQITLVTKEVSVPQKMESIVLRRLSGIEQETRGYLEFMSVLGMKISPDVVRYAFGLNRMETIRLFRKFLRTGFIVQDSGFYRFYHDYIRDVIYGGIDELMRIEYHKIAAECIEESEISEAERFSLVAEHYYQSMNYDKALDNALKGIMHTDFSLAPREGIKLYELAIKCAVKLEKNEVIRECHYNLGNLYAEIGEYDTALQHYRIALEMESDYLCYLKMGGVYFSRGEYDNAEKYYIKSLELAGENVPEVEAALGNLYVRMGEFEKAEDAFTNYLAWAERGGKIHVLLAHKYLGSFYWYRREPDKAMLHYTTALNIAEDTRMAKHQADLLHNMGTIYYLKGDNKRALEYVLRSLEMREKIGDITGYPVTANFLGLIYWNLGDEDTAEEYFNSALRYYRLLGRRSGEAHVLSNLGIMAYYRDEYDAAFEYLNRSVEIFRKIGEESGILEPFLYRISCEIEKSNINGAEKDIALAEELVKKLSLSGYDKWILILRERIEFEKSGKADWDMVLSFIGNDPLYKGIAHHHIWKATGDLEALKLAYEYFIRAGFHAPLKRMSEEMDGYK